MAHDHIFDFSFMHHCVPFDEKHFISLGDIAKLRYSHLLEFLLQMTNVFLTVLALALRGHLSKNVCWMKILPSLLFVPFDKLWKNCHQNIPHSVLVIHAKKVLIRTCHLKMILALLLEKSGWVFQVNGHQIGRKLIFSHLQVVAMYKLKMKNEKEEVLVDSSTFDAFWLPLFCFSVFIGDSWDPA